jgi:hypothetical protein
MKLSAEDHGISRQNRERPRVLSGAIPTVPSPSILSIKQASNRCWLSSRTPERVMSTSGPHRFKCAAAGNIADQRFSVVAAVPIRRRLPPRSHANRRMRLQCQRGWHRVATAPCVPASRQASVLWRLVRRLPSPPGQPLRAAGVLAVWSRCRFRVRPRHHPT